MKCDNCGNTANLGDQYCLNCGAKLNSNNAIMPGIDKIKEEERKDHHKLIFLSILGVILFAVLIFGIYFMVKK